jgi:transposase InsO family protein
MNSHKKARLTLQGRKLLIKRIDTEGLTPAAEAAGVSPRTYSRVGFARMRPDEREGSTVAFLLASIARYAALGVRIRRFLTDNGPSFRSRLFAQTCQLLGIEHRFARPDRPQTSGKAERFIQACLRGWAYARIWQGNEERNACLPAFMDDYNSRRPHSAMAYQPPLSRIEGNNLLQLNTRLS